MSRIYADVKPMALYTADSERWNPGQKFTAFNGAGNIVHDNGQPVTINGRKCEQASEQEAEYNQCNFDTNYDALIRSVQSTMQVSEGLIIPPGFRAAYWTDKQHMLSNGIPSWSKVNRDARQTFLPTLLNKTAQCRYASREVRLGVVAGLTCLAVGVDRVALACKLTTNSGVRNRCARWNQTTGTTTSTRGWAARSTCSRPLMIFKKEVRIAPPAPPKTSSLEITGEEIH